MYDKVDNNKLYFNYVGFSKHASFYEYMDSKELFNESKDKRARFNDALKKQQEFLKKINEVKMVNETPEEKEVINNLENVHKPREEVCNFSRDFTKLFFDDSY